MESKELRDAIMHLLDHSLKHFIRVIGETETEADFARCWVTDNNGKIFEILITEVGE